MYEIDYFSIIVLSSTLSREITELRSSVATIAFGVLYICDF